MPPANAIAHGPPGAAAAIADPIDITAAVVLWPAISAARDTSLKTSPRVAQVFADFAVAASVCFCVSATIFAVSPASSITWPNFHTSGVAPFAPIFSMS